MMKASYSKKFSLKIGYQKMQYLLLFIFIFLKLIVNLTGSLAVFIYGRWFVIVTS